MGEALYRHRQTVNRLFGPSAALTGTIGSARGPGTVEVRLHGESVASGLTTEAAIRQASRVMSAAVRLTTGTDRRG